MLRNAFLVLLFAVMPCSVQADQLTIPIVNPCTACPSSGMTMDTVKSRFGEPQQTYPAVGDPPITRWVYGNFTVYFEYDRVIHAVTKS